MAKALRFCFVSLLVFSAINLSLSAYNPNQQCQDKLRRELAQDVERLVGVYLVSKTPEAIQAASNAAQSQVQANKIASGKGIVEPVGEAVQYAVKSSFQSGTDQFKTTTTVFIQTALKRLCALENCCFGAN